MRKLAHLLIGIVVQIHYKNYVMYMIKLGLMYFLNFIYHLLTGLPTRLKVPLWFEFEHWIENLKEGTKKMKVYVKYGWKKEASDFRFQFHNG